MLIFIILYVRNIHSFQKEKYIHVKFSLSNNLCRNRIYQDKDEKCVPPALQPSSADLWRQTGQPSTGLEHSERCAVSIAVELLRQYQSPFLQLCFACKTEPFTKRPTQNVTQNLQNMFFKCSESQKLLGRVTNDPVNTGSKMF